MNLFSNPAKKPQKENKLIITAEDELVKITIDSVRKSINEFIGRYEKELTIENIDFLTEYIWQVINKRENILNNIKDELEK